MNAKIFEGNSFRVTDDRLEANGMLTLENEEAIVRFRYMGDSYTKEREEKCLDMRYLKITYRQKNGKDYSSAGIENIRGQIFVSFRNIDSLIELDGAEEVARGIGKVLRDARDIQQYMDYWFPEDCQKDLES